MKYYSQTTLLTQLRKVGNTISRIVDNPTPTIKELKQLHDLLRERNSLKHQLKQLRENDYKYSILYSDEDWHKAMTKKRQRKTVQTEPRPNSGVTSYQNLSKDIIKKYTFDEIYSWGLLLCKETMELDNPNLSYKGENWVTQEYVKLSPDMQQELGGYYALLWNLSDLRDALFDQYKDAEVRQTQLEIDLLRKHCDIMVNKYMPH